MQAPQNLDDFLSVMNEKFKPEDIAITIGQVVFGSEAKPVLIGKLIMDLDLFVKEPWADLPWIHVQELYTSNAHRKGMMVFWVAASDSPSLFEAARQRCEDVSQSLYNLISEALQCGCDSLDKSKLN